MIIQIRAKILSSRRFYRVRESYWVKGRRLSIKKTPSRLYQKDPIEQKILYWEKRDSFQFIQILAMAQRQTFFGDELDGNLMLRRFPLLRTFLELS